MRNIVNEAEYRIDDNLNDLQFEPSSSRISEI